MSTAGFLRGDVIEHAGRTFTLKLDNGVLVSCSFYPRGAYTGFNEALKLPYACHCDGTAEMRDGKPHFVVTKVVDAEMVRIWERKEAESRARSDRVHERKFGRAPWAS